MNKLRFRQVKHLKMYIGISPLWKIHMLMSNKWPQMLLKYHLYYKFFYESENYLQKLQTNICKKTFWNIVKNALNWVFSFAVWKFLFAFQNHLDFSQITFRWFWQLLSSHSNSLFKANIRQFWFPIKLSGWLRCQAVKLKGTAVFFHNQTPS